jgi:hypothetical protein
VHVCARRTGSGRVCARCAQRRTCAVLPRMIVSGPGRRLSRPASARAFPRAPRRRRRRPRHMFPASLTAGAIPPVRIHHAAPPARRARPRSGPHYDLAHVKNGLPSQKDGTLVTRDLRIDERTDVVLAADQVRSVSASSLRRPRPHAHLARDSFFRLQPSMSFDPQD